jgi:methionine-rich copper-binding protein CopC
MRALTLAAAMAVALVPAIAFAHAIVMSALPPANAHFLPGPLEIRLQFNSRIDLDRSRIILQGPDDADRSVAVSRNEPDGMLAGRASVPIAGPWKIRWQVLSTDGHITRGEIPFFVDEDRVPER